jgi:hypothetical protein
MAPGNETDGNWDASMVFFDEAEINKIRKRVKDSQRTLAVSAVAAVKAETLKSGSTRVNTRTPI